MALVGQAGQPTKLEIEQERIGQANVVLLQSHRVVVVGDRPRIQRWQSARMPRFLFIRFFSSITVAAGGRTDGKRTRTAMRGSVIDGRLDGVGQKLCLLPIAERRLAALLLHSDAHFRLLLFPARNWTRRMESTTIRLPFEQFRSAVPAEEFLSYVDRTMTISRHNWTQLTKTKQMSNVQSLHQ